MRTFIEAIQESDPEALEIWFMENAVSTIRPGTKDRAMNRHFKAVF